MLRQNERLRYNGLFMQAFEKGKTLSSLNLRLTYTFTRDDCAERLPLVGFVVSKKFSKSAVIRNKYKRALREIYRLFRLNTEKAEALKKIGLLVIALRNSVKPEKDISVFKTFKNELEDLIEKAINATKI